MNGPAERNSARDIVIDLETDIHSLKAYQGLLKLSASAAADGHLTDDGAGEGLLKLAFDMEDCLEHHHAQYRHLFDAVVKQGEVEPASKPAKPSAASTVETDHSHWQKLYGEWLRVKAAYIEDDVTDEEGDRLGDREAELVQEMVRPPAPCRHAIIAKLDILQDCMDQGHG